MPDVIPFPDGGYRFVRGASPYSAGVAAEPGFEIERVRFRTPVPLEEGFRRIEARLASAGRPRTALCACELRSPRPFTLEGFIEFNKGYVAVLEEWNVVRGGLNPVARTNVCPEIDPPAVPSFFAFSYTRPAPPGAPSSFVVAGSGEVPEGKGNYPDRIIRRGDVSPEGLREKARWVMGELERRLRALGAGWPDVTATQLYTVHDVHPFLADELVRRGAARGGVTWHFARPPVVALDFEMDCRGVGRERQE
jgi:hypothetical protein